MNEDLLQQLRGLSEPAAPGWWPPAPGWWLLAAAGIGAAIVATRWLLDRRRRQAPARAASAELKTLSSAHASGELSDDNYIDAANELLKRIASTAGFAGPARVAWGDAWLILLDTVTNSADFTDGPGRVLGSDRYRDRTRDPKPFDAPGFARVTGRAATRLAKARAPTAESADPPANVQSEAETGAQT